MPEPHLTPEQIAAIRDDELRDSAVVRHLRTCSECRTRLRQARTLRVLLSRPEAKTSPHPEPEELAAYASETLSDRDTRRLAAHLAACPQCFADLDAIQTHMRPAATSAESAPDWVVARAVGSFQPPQTPLSLGTLVVEWVRRFGLSLRLIPAAGEAGAFSGAVFESRGFGFVAGPRKLASPASERMPLDADFDLSTVPEEPSKQSEIRALRDSGAVPPERESEPIEVTVGDLCARITARGRAGDQIHMIIGITRREDNAPVAGAQLSMETETGPPVSATTDTSGGTTLSLTQGEGTLTFLSPVRAELKISF